MKTASNTRAAYRKNRWGPMLVDICCQAAEDDQKSYCFRASTGRKRYRNAERRAAIPRPEVHQAPVVIVEASGKGCPRRSRASRGRWRGLSQLGSELGDDLRQVFDVARFLVLNALVNRAMQRGI